MEVYRLDHAHILSKESVLLETGKEDCQREIGCFSYLIKSDEEWILVDCGMEDIDVANQTKSSKDHWSRSEKEESILEALKLHGVSSQQITKIFLTHSHYDHLSGVIHFENATVYMTEMEWRYLKENNPHKKYLLDAISFLEKKAKKEKFVLINDGYQFENGNCCLIGAHTPGSMMILIENCLFTGDAVFLLENIEKEIPIGFCTDRTEAKKAIMLCKQHQGPILTGHDLKCPKVIK